ncbi:response regulator transcription factor [Bifidobacterium sp. MA2]|uniref:Response regulator transcription factor n=1 Tax=Bifidobacterium santillanense TaxID=2809028 RepID=A0ABS5UPV1_9BIFI|nr:response regulator transcription factor [Bifidobacterium santillanense]MBT1172894.1 response regulator transcription factor [Bifidobacterium santillanense]
MLHLATTPSLAIVDNDERSLESLQQLLTNRLPSARITWMATSGREALSLSSKNAPSLLLLDMSLEGIQGPSVCRHIRKESSAFPILAMTSFSLNLYEAKVKSSGAQGLVSKNREDDLVQCITSILHDGAMPGFESRKIAHIRITSEKTHNPRLTLREEEIINLSADEGLLDAEIADKLGVSEATVRKHMQHIMQKLGARTARQAVAIWLSPHDY